MIYAALLGLGVVGSGTAEVLTKNKKLIEKKVGDRVEIKYILDLRDFPDSPFGPLVVHDFSCILNDPQVTVVAEMMGGAHPAYDFTKSCLLAGKSVVTSNKEVVATYGTELLRIAAEHGAAYLFEASVGGGIPIIRPLREDLAPNHVSAISGILNGTTNYILTQMETEGTPFDEALKQAQSKGYAERNPSADIDGLDAARKAVILAAMAFGKRLDPNAIPCEGITTITAEDTALARSMGYSIKLIAHTEQADGKILAMVSPRLVPLSNPLGGINGVFNGILVTADMVGQVMFYGPGAGKLPTASAVVSDMIDIMEHSPSGIHAPVWTDADEADVFEFSGYTCARLLVFQATASALDTLTAQFGSLHSMQLAPGRLSFVTDPLSEADTDQRISDCGLPLVSRIRLL